MYMIQKEASFVRFLSSIQVSMGNQARPMIMMGGKSMPIEAENLLAVPAEKVPLTSDLLLKLHESVEKGLGSRRAARHVDVHGHNPVAAADDRV